jgi:vitamin B12 transporter
MIDPGKWRLLNMVPAVFFAQPVLAQTVAPDEPIIVTGRPLAEPETTAAYAALTLTRDNAATAASGRLEEVLAAAPGFQQFRRSDSRSANPSAQGVTLRGLGGNATSRTLVLLDGVPLADPFFGHVPFSALPFDRLDHAVITSGGGSGPFGAGAVAGTVQLFSAGPDQLGTVSASAMANDRGESELSASLSPRLGSGFAVVSGRWDRGQGFWTTPVNQRVAASVPARFESWSTALRTVAPLTGDVELQARALLFDDHRTLRFQGADSTSTGGDASLRLIGRGAWQFDALGYVQVRDFSNVVISSTAFRRTLDQRKTPATGIGGKLELRPPLGGDHTLRLGIDFRQMRGEMREDAYNATTGALTARRAAGGVNSDLGFYAEQGLALGKLALTGTARADRWSVAQGHFTEFAASGVQTSNLAFADRSGWKASLRGGMRFDAGGGLALRAAAYSGLRQPTLNELYRPFVVFPVTTRANAALANEVLAGFEGGLDFSPSAAVQLHVTAYDNRIKGAIANVTIATNLRERRNLDAIHARGIEVAGAVRVGSFDFDAGLAVIDAAVEASGISALLNGKRPAQVPKFSASTTLGWHPRSGILLAATLRHISAQFEDDLETDRLAAATTLSAVISLPLTAQIALVLRGENLTNAQVITRNQAGSIDLGAPRTVWGGVKFAF